MLLEDSYVKFLIEHDLTQSQYLLLHLVHKGRVDLIRAYKAKFPSGDDTMIGEYMTKELFTKGFLQEVNGKVSITTKFLEAFIDKHSAAEEIFAMYPTHFMKDGVQIPLSAMDRNLFANLYDIAIQSSILEHLEVVEDIKFAIGQDILNIGIDKFVKSKYWLVVRPLRLENQIKTNTVTRRDFEY